jgi:UDP-N-acetylmuramoylalanine--D-glutamate ligase
MCRRAGLKTVVAGNIGLPVLDALMETEHSDEPDVYVLELSSFQLETISSLHLNAATVLNISEDHMDRYASVASYAAAKARIFLHAKVQVINREDATVWAMANRRATVYTFGLGSPSKDREWGLIGIGDQRCLAEGQQRLIPAAELSISGLHNAGNALAALALSRALDLPYAPLLDALRTFKGLPHRVEKVAVIGGVTYFDDSKGTNVGATLAALSGMGVPVVLIAGGDGKGQDFSPLKDMVAKHARAVILIGRDAPLIESAICASQVPVEHASNLREAVQRAGKLAVPGDAVLLSPACASFDMFRNYVHRAEAFINAVMELQGKEPQPNVERNVL